MDPNAIKKQLLALKEDIKKRIEQTQQHIRHVEGPVEQDFVEQAVSRKNDDVVYNLDSLAKSELQQINTALQKIEKGTYGACSRCGEDIDPERLRALPYAENCRDCAQG